MSHDMFDTWILAVTLKASKHTPLRTIIRVWDKVEPGLTPFHSYLQGDSYTLQREVLLMVI
jgi:hypothetical protein